MNFEKFKKYNTGILTKMNSDIINLNPELERINK